MESDERGNIAEGALDKKTKLGLPEYMVWEIGSVNTEKRLKQRRTGEGKTHNI